MFYQIICVVLSIYLFRRFQLSRKMFKQGSPLFTLGYNVYTKTRLGNYLNGRDLSKTRLEFPDGHSVVDTEEYAGFTITPIPYLKDNYAYLVEDTVTQVAVVIDPGDADAVQTVVARQGVPLSAIFTTHRHWDHSGGNKKLKSIHPDLAIYGNAEDRVPGSTHKIGDGESVQIGNLKFTALFTPGHTVGHTVYLLTCAQQGSPGCLFTGDLLFLAGNGRMFEGPPSQMLSSLDKVCELPDDTAIYPGHEYALDDLEFALHIDPENEAVKRKLNWVKGRRKDTKITSPSSLGEEKSYNPFLRTSQENILRLADPEYQTATDRQALRAKALLFLRKSKDNFRYKL
ncbi:probable hydrolase PNKD [Diadema antillarum]|uniref:probable hydrolase PNKD n=1 Tax=Diadema antillarum TaxID=105358 RepID=UPI003A889FDE